MKFKVSVPLMCTALVLGGCQTTQMQTYNPFAGVRDTFEGKYIDHVVANPPAPGKGQSSLVGTFKGMFDSDDKGAVKNSGEMDGVTLSRLFKDGVVSLPELEKRLNDIAQHIVAQWPLERPMVKVYLEPTKDINARAEPDGSIFIPLHILYEMKDIQGSASLDDAVGCLLAHEIAHILLRHHDVNHFKNVQKRAYGAVSTSLNMIAAANKLRAQLGNGEESNEEKLLRLAVINFLGDWMTNDVLTTSWSRDAENGADLLAMDLALLAGYDYNGFEKFFNALQSVENVRLKEYEAQKKQFGEQMELAFHDKKIGEVFEQGMTALMRDIMHQWKTQVSAEHDNASERYDAVMGYFIDVYDDVVPAAQKPLAKNTLDRIIEYKTTKNAYQGLKASQEAVLLAQTGQSKEADKAAKIALNGSVSDDPFVRLNLYRARRAQGQEDRALANINYILNKFDKNTKPTFGFYSEAVDGYLASEKVDMAEKLVDVALEDFGDVDYLLPIQLKVARAKGDNGTALALMTRCNLTGENELIESCKNPQEKQTVQQQDKGNFLKKLFN